MVAAIQTFGGGTIGTKRWGGNGNRCQTSWISKDPVQIFLMCRAPDDWSFRSLQCCLRQSGSSQQVRVIILQHCDLYDISHQNSNHQNSIASDPTFFSEVEQHNIFLFRCGLRGIPCCYLHLVILFGIRASRNLAPLGFRPINKVFERPGL